MAHMNANQMQINTFFSKFENCNSRIGNWFPSDPILSKLIAVYGYVSQDRVGVLNSTLFYFPVVCQHFKTSFQAREVRN